MKTWKRLTLAMLIPVVVSAILIAVYITDDFIANLWWFQALDYGFYFWLRLLYQSVMFLVVTLFLFLVFFLNFWVGSRYLGAAVPAEADGEPRASAPTPSSAGGSYGTSRPTTAGPARTTRYQRIYDRFQRRSLLFYLPLTLGLAVLVALPVYGHWETAILYIFSRDSGITDPAFGHDISYYLFALPFYLLLWRGLLFASMVLLLGLALLYWLERWIVNGSGRPLRRGAKLHLNLAAGGVVLIGAWYFMLDRHLLLYADPHLPVFSGPGYVEMNYILPLIWTAMILALTLGALFIWLVNTRKGLPALAIVAVLFAGTLALRYSPVVPGLLQEYVVKPDELSLQSPFIDHNIRATLAAYDLNEVETRQYPIQDIPWDTTSPEFQETIVNIPIWDEFRLHRVFQELQEIRSYYTLNSIDVDRYTVDGVYQQVAVSPREIDLDNLPEGSRNWVNEWMKYTHGYGAVMAPTAQRAAGAIRWLMQGIPPQSAFGLTIEQPGIYFGASNYSPVIAPNNSREIDYAGDDEIVLSDYNGTGGVKISNWFRRIVFSLYFGEINIFLTNQINQDSRILFRRNIVERVSTLTPFLLLDPDPYAVVTPERIYWIQDTYTLSRWYPYSYTATADFAGVPHTFNTIRNSAKVVIDAYDGSVSYYVSEPDDPIIRAYARAYPGVFKPFSEMPDQLQQHVRYPKRLFDIQLGIYGRYQQRDPRTFFKQEDLWVYPEVQWENEVRVIKPYYVTLNLLDPERLEFSLLAPMNPKGKNNMRALVVAGNDGENYGRIVAYSFPRGTLVYGPAQGDAFVKQDPRITQEFALWNRQGAQAERGSLVVMPVNGVIASVQGVFLKAQTGASFPELVRFIAIVGERVAMAATIEAAFSAVNKTAGARDAAPAPGGGAVSFPDSVEIEISPDVAPEANAESTDDE
ncbi:UPF0182 family protein [Thiocapsa rosea]|uniref:UPF0182 protein BDD21_0126 n=1 Tax=Thiocapsa rosea TaxID=69360 RepID=A0A495V041_9GAMM|nr:UPF0182 family protein [Thiocapsa rosea]RKT42831.1 hypothetical protein BDD21_0126 [Thiocapsa rosea]